MLQRAYISTVPHGAPLRLLDAPEGGERNYEGISEWSSDWRLAGGIRRGRLCGRPRTEFLGTAVRACGSERAARRAGRARRFDVSDRDPVPRSVRGGFLADSPRATGNHGRLGGR